MITELHRARLETVAGRIIALGARRVLDLGCGDGALALALVARGLEVTAIDADRAALGALAAARARLAPALAARLTIAEGSLLEAGGLPGRHDVTALVEVFEHLPPERLGALEQVLFGAGGAPVVVLTTPNADFNLVLGVPAHRMRHPGHRFEWGRARFASWAGRVAAAHGYEVELRALGVTVAGLGGPSQMAVFRRAGAACAADGDQNGISSSRSWAGA